MQSRESPVPSAPQGALPRPSSRPQTLSPLPRSLCHLRIPTRGPGLHSRKGPGAVAGTCTLSRVCSVTAGPALTHVDETHDQVRAAQASLRGPDVFVVVAGHGTIQVQHEERRRRGQPGGGGWCAGPGPPGQPEHRQDLALHVAALARSQTPLGTAGRGARAGAAAQGAQCQAQEPERPGERGHGGPGWALSGRASAPRLDPGCPDGERRTRLYGRRDSGGAVPPRHLSRLGTVWMRPLPPRGESYFRDGGPPTNPSWSAVATSTLEPDLLSGPGPLDSS